MVAKDKIFREYDIRGVVGDDFDAELAKFLGFALGTSARTGTFGPAPSGRPKVAVGFDCRLTREEMTAAMTAGLTASGCDVTNTGMGPTPQLYFIAVSQKCRQPHTIHKTRCLVLRPERYRAPDR